MHIVKQDNGLYKVELKGLAYAFYVEEYNQALEIVFKMRGLKND